MLETFRVRLRFRLQRSLNIPSAQHQFDIGGRQAIISALSGSDIRDSSWLVVNVTGFASEHEAATFGANLKAACEFSSVAARLGIDTGLDLPSSAVSTDIKASVHESSGFLLRDNIHGVDVFVDHPNVRILNLEAAGKVLASPDPFLSDITHFHTQADRASQTARDIVLLLNYALMRPDPVAQLVFAFSAVEMLGQSDWSSSQKDLLAKLADSAATSEFGTPDERAEVAEAITRGMHRISLRQGVFRLLKSLGLERLKSQWDALYAERSTLVHGLAPRPGVEYGDFAQRVVSLCGRILLTFVGREVERTNAHVERFYPPCTNPHPAQLD
jgi:hypothetical protein